MQNQDLPQQMEVFTKWPGPNQVALACARRSTVLAQCEHHVSVPRDESWRCSRQTHGALPIELYYRDALTQDPSYTSCFDPHGPHDKGGEETLCTTRTGISLLFAHLQELGENINSILKTNMHANVRMLYLICLFMYLSHQCQPLPAWSMSP